MTAESLLCSGWVGSTTSEKRFSAHFCATLVLVEQIGMFGMDVRGIPGRQLALFVAGGQGDADPASPPFCWSWCLFHSAG